MRADLRSAPLVGPTYSQTGVMVLEARRKDPTMPNFQISLPLGA